METVVVERMLERPLDVNQLVDDRERIENCLQAHGVSLLHSYVEPGGLRMICVYQAPDAESVRLALRQYGRLPFTRAWRATVMQPQDFAPHRPAGG